MHQYVEKHEVALNIQIRAKHWIGRALHAQFLLEIKKSMNHYGHSGEVELFKVEDRKLWREK